MSASTRQRVFVALATFVLLASGAGLALAANANDQQAGDPPPLIATNRALETTSGSAVTTTPVPSQPSLPRAVPATVEVGPAPAPTARVQGSDPQSSEAKKKDVKSDRDEKREESDEDDDDDDDREIVKPEIRDEDDDDHDDDDHEDSPERD